MIDPVVMKIIPPRMGVIPVVYCLLGVELNVDFIPVGGIQSIIASRHVETVVVVVIDAIAMTLPRDDPFIRHGHEVHVWAAPRARVVIHRHRGALWILRR